MSPRWLCVCALLMFAFSPAFAQSLGDVARASRAARERSSTRPKVITNDDIVSVQASAVKSADEEEAATAQGEQNAKGSEPVTGTSIGTKPGEAATKLKAKSDPAEERDKQEAERQKRTEEINQQYTSKIEGLQKQIETARAQLSKLQNEQLDNSFRYQRTSGASQNPVNFEQEQQAFKDQIEEQRNQITKLTTDLEDAKEAARHAGVPHVTD